MLSCMEEKKILLTHLKLPYHGKQITSLIFPTTAAAAVAQKQN